MSDCTMALRYNNRYVKAMERRARIARKQSVALANSSEDEAKIKEAVSKLKMALEDMTAVCILEGFQKQEHMIFVDSILKELGKEKVAFSSFSFLLLK